MKYTLVSDSSAFEASDAKQRVKQTNSVDCSKEITYKYYKSDTLPVAVLNTYYLTKGSYIFDECKYTKICINVHRCKYVEACIEM